MCCFHGNTHGFVICKNLSFLSSPVWLAGSYHTKGSKETEKRLKLSFWRALTVTEFNTQAWEEGFLWITSHVVWGVIPAVAEGVQRALKAKAQRINTPFWDVLIEVWSPFVCSVVLCCLIFPTPLAQHYLWLAITGSRSFHQKQEKKKKTSVKDAEEAGELKKHRAVPASAASLLKLMMETILSANTDYLRVWVVLKLLLQWIKQEPSTERRLEVNLHKWAAERETERETDR